MPFSKVYWHGLLAYQILVALAMVGKWISDSAWQHLRLGTPNTIEQGSKQTFIDMRKDYECSKVS